MRKISKTIEKEILSAYNSDKTYQKIADSYKLSKTSVFRLLKKNGVIKPLCQKGAKKKLSTRKETQILRKFNDKEFSFASDASKWANNSFSLDVSPQTVRRMLKKNGINSYKKQKKTIFNSQTY